MSQTNSALSNYESFADASSVDDNASFPAELGTLLQHAAELAAQNGVSTETFMAAAWAACLESHPGLREELEDKELKSQLKKLRKRGLVAMA
ncbi:MAG: hypothetical protein JWP01_1148 [Myxococcales bacterium]|nr:hypothetical protein [Myxococcales bacterium]